MRPEQVGALALAVRLAEELLAADGYVLSVPMHDVGVSQHVRTGLDLVLADPRSALGHAPLAVRPCW